MPTKKPRVYLVLTDEEQAAVHMDDMSSLEHFAGTAIHPERRLMRVNINESN